MRIILQLNCQSYKVIPGSLHDTWAIKVQGAYLKVIAGAYLVNVYEFIPRYTARFTLV